MCEKGYLWDDRVLLCGFLYEQADFNDFLTQLPNIAIFRKILDRLTGLD